jgi:hypothetical protein
MRIRLVSILFLALSSGCSTMPVVLPPPHLQKPTTCLLPAPDALAKLIPGFEALPLTSPDNLDQAHALLKLHAADGLTYATMAAELRDCQNFIGGLP